MSSTTSTRPRSADEYDAAQERGEVAGSGFKGNQWSVPKGNAPATVSDLGLTRKAIHEARQLRDAEAAVPGIIAVTSASIWPFRNHP